MRQRWPGIALAVVLGAACSDSGLAQPATAIPATQQRVALAQAVAAPCVSIALAQATIGLPRRELERAAQVRRAFATAPKDDAQQRLAWIAGERAQALLEVAGDTSDRFGCALVERAQVPTDALYLVGQWLERGQAAVWTDAAPGPAAAVEVKRINPHCQHGPMGSVSYRIASGGPPLLTLIECVT